VTISGGTVTATGSTGIGGGGGSPGGSGGSVTIDGGSVYASIQPAVFNSNGNQEYLVTISGLPASAGVSYTVDEGSPVDCSTDGYGALYLWLGVRQAPQRTTF
jgi:hypothetical protein